MADEEGRRVPAWNWSQLPEEELRFELRDLAKWVAELQLKHGRWVRLPQCWPVHRGLRDELAAFWYWRQRLDQTKGVSMEENTRWYHSLRVAAQAWAEAYGGCRHETKGEIDELRVDPETVRVATRGYLDEALEDLVERSRSGDGQGVRGVRRLGGDGGATGA